jgi:hypothetical protein
MPSICSVGGRTTWNWGDEVVHYKWKIRYGKAKRVLMTLITNPRSITRVINRENEMKRRVNNRHRIEEGLPIKNILSLVPNLTDFTVRPYLFSYGSTLSIEVAMMKGIAHQIPECRFLEIGTYRGETAANLASVCKEVVTVDMDKEAGKFCRGISNVKQVIDDSITMDWKRLGKFDLIFIDGNHSYIGVKADTENALCILKEGGIIVWHDYTMRFRLEIEGRDHIRWEVLAAILDGVPKDDHKHLSYISNTMSVVFCKRQLEDGNENIFEVSINNTRRV